MLLGLPALLQISKIWPKLALFLPIFIYLIQWYFNFFLSADPHSDRVWFFNPFAWQLQFFSGFIVAAGWVQIKPSRRLLWLCAVFVLLAIPLSHFPTLWSVQLLHDARNLLEPFLNKTNLGLLRWVHFMALAILIRAVLQNWPTLINHWSAQGLIKMGQQSLPIYLSGMVLSFLGGIMLDQYGHGASVLFFVNVGGILLLTISAYALNWLDTKPWKQYRYQHDGFESTVTIS